MTPIPHYLVLDIETTGLFPTKDHILEVGVIVVSQQLDYITEISWVVQHENPEFWMSDLVRDMHTKNGLIEACKKSDYPLGRIEDLLIELIVPQFPEKPILLGSTIDFDKNFIAVDMPRFHEKLHYRKVDVTGPKLLIEGLTGKKFKKAEAHRSIPDCRESLEHARIVREILQEGLQAFESAGYHSPLHGVMQ